MSLEIKYRGYVIGFYEYDESWNCRALDMTGEGSLKALKRKIDKWDVSQRRIGKVDVIVVSNGWSGNDMREAAITTIAEQENHEIAKDGHSVWGSFNEKGRYGKSREKFSISRLALSTPENKRLVEQARKLAFEAKAKEDEAQKVIDCIPRLKIEDLKTLVAERLDDEDEK